MKQYDSEPSFQYKSFGTNETFHPSKRNNSKLKLLTDKLGSPNFNRRNEFTENLPEITSKQSRSLPSKPSERKDTFGVGPYEFKPVSTLRLPHIDSGSISVIGSIMGAPTKVQETDENSHFVEKAESEIMTKRMHEVELAGRTPTPRSFRTSPRVLESKKPKYLVDKEFWDTGSRKTRRIRFSPVSGFDPNDDEAGRTRNWRRQSAASYPK